MPWMPSGDEPRSRRRAIETLDLRRGGDGMVLGGGARSGRAGRGTPEILAPGLIPSPANDGSPIVSPDDFTQSGAPRGSFAGSTAEGRQVGESANLAAIAAVRLRHAVVAALGVRQPGR
jgi:hypothetical protein